MYSVLLTLVTFVTIIAFISGDKELVYKYESQVVTGVPHQAIQYAGVKVKADVRLQQRRDGITTLKMGNVMIYKIETTVEESWPETGIFPDSKLNPVEPTIMKEMKKQLTKPVKFNYRSGSVDSIKMDPQEALWSVNIKKAVLANFKINLKHESVNQLNDEHKEMFPVLEEDIEEKTESTGKMYKVMESSVCGECESVYSIKKESQTSDEMKVIKIRNYDQCIKKPVYEQGLISGLTMNVEPKESKDVIERSSQANYNIKGTSTDFIIKEMIQDSRYIFTPLKPTDGNVVTTVTQVMTLVESKRLENRIFPQMSLELRPTGLTYEFPFTPTGRTESDMEYVTGDEMTMIDRLLDEALPKMTPLVQPEVVEKVKVIGSLIRRLSEREMIDLCEKYLASEVHTAKAEIVLDLIPTLTSPKVMKVVYHLMKNSLISTTRAVISLQTMAATVSPDLDLIKFLHPSSRDSLRHPTILGNRVLKRVILTTLGSMWKRWIREIQNENALSPTEAMELIDIKQRIQDFTSQYYALTDPSDKVAYMKAIQNSGVPLMNKLITNTIFDKSENEIVRRNAIFALQTLKHKKYKIESVLTTVYRDFTEKPSIRISAFVAIMDKRPGSDVLNIITRVQRSEKSLQVGSFVYSYLTTLSKAQIPGLRELAEKITRIKPLIKPFSPDSIVTSKGIHIDIPMILGNMVSGVEVMKINDGSSMTPSTVISRMMLHVFGKTVHVMQGGVRIEGINSILSKLLGVQSGMMGFLGDKSLRQIIEAVLIPLQSGSVDLGSMAEEIKTIIDKLGIIERPVLEKLNVNMWLSVLGNDFTFLDITTDDILNCLETGELPIIGNINNLGRELTLSGKTVHIMKVLNLGTSTLQVPTPAGIPVSLNFTATGVLNVNGDVSLTGISLMDIISNGMPSEVGIQADIKSSHCWEWVAAFGADMGLIKTGVALKGSGKSRIPVKFDVKGNTQRSKLTISFEIPNEETEVLNVRIDPSVFLTLIDPTKKVQNRILSTTLLTHPSRAIVMEIKVPFSMKHLNTRCVQTYVNPDNVPKWMSYRWLWGPFAILTSCSSISRGTPVDIEIEASINHVSARDFVPEEMTVHPLLSQGRGIKIRHILGPRGNPRYTNNIVLTVITSPDMMKSQINSIAKFPSSMTAPFITDVTFNLEALFPRRLQTMNPSIEAGQFTMKLNSKYFTIKSFPSPNEKIPWNKYKDNMINVLTDWLDNEDITYKTITPTTESTPELNYKITLDTNINQDEISRPTTALISAIATTVYMKLGTRFPITYIHRINRPPSCIEGQLTILPEFQTIRTIMRTPSSMQYNFEVPMYLYKPWHQLISLETPVKITDNIMDNFPVYDKYLISPLDTISGICTVHLQPGREVEMVKTYDSMTYDIPSLPRSCEVVLTKDCSRFSLFTVLMKPMENTKVLTVIIPNHKIQLVPVTSWLSSSTNVKVIVDGEEIQTQEDIPEGLREMGSKYAEVKKSENWVTLKVSGAGLTLSTDGKKVLISTSPFMRRHTCGMCGNFNDDIIDEYEGPDMSVYPTTEEMISRYVVGNQHCSVEDVRSLYGIKDLSYESCTPTERNVVFEQSGETCFSILPVPVCLVACRPDGISRSEIRSFFCKPSNNIRTRYLIEESRSRVLKELELKPTDTRVSVDIPSNCVRTD